MPNQVQMEQCIAREGEAWVFWSPDPATRRASARLQIIDVFTLQIASGYIRDPQGRLLLESHSSLAAGRSWSIAKAAQLIRNDARPHRWVALHQDNRAWGLFWAGGGLQHMRQLLSEQRPEAETCSALVPVTPETLLRLVLDLESGGASSTSRRSRAPAPTRHSTATANPWRLVAWTSLAWLAVLGFTVTSFLQALERQDRKLELLLKQTAPALPSP